MRSILLKPVGSFCNLRCEYCFYLDKAHLYAGPPATHRMGEWVLKKVIQEMFELAGAPAFTWHGGEPTLAGLDFYKTAVAYQRRFSKGKPFTNSMQTNGLLLDEDWADFFRQEDFLVGISLDGPAHIHDHYRKDAQGHGTFARVFENARLLLEKGVQVNILATVNPLSVRHGVESYRFFRDNGFVFMQFNPVLEPDKTNPGRIAPYSVDPRDYGGFLIELFEAWFKDFDFRQLKQKTSIRFFDALIQCHAGIMPDHCLFQKRCGNYLVCEHNGDLFSCDYLVAENTRIGNLKDMSLEAAFVSERHGTFADGKAVLDRECEGCPWLALCRGGCIKDRLHDPKDRGRNHFCTANKYFFQRAEKRFQKLADLYRQHYA